MYRPDAERAEAGKLPPGFQPRIVVKLRDGVDTRARVASLAVAPTEGGSAPEPLVPLARRFPGATIAPLFSSTTPAQLASMQREAERAAEAKLPDLTRFHTVTVPRGTDPAALIAAARNLTDVEDAYLQGQPTPPPVHASDDPRATNQGYLDAAPKGIDARYAWTIAGGDGRNLNFIDVERGWTLGHEDLSGARVTLVSGQNQDFFGHGTSVLGEVLSQDNTRGCVGITPMVSARVVSQWRTATNYSTGDAIIAAVVAARPGDVILLEAQTRVGTQNNLPVEVELDVWAAIRVGTWYGRVIVEAGGNGGHDLDTYRDATHGFILRRGHANFRESGAIIVGAASSATPHTRLNFSNYGSRVDCYAWGQNIDTTGDGWTGNLTTSYTTSFGGTSGASPIVTGAAIALQAMTKAKTGRTLPPHRVRQILCDRANGTASAHPAADRIGVMPDLRRIVASQNLKPPVGDFPMPRTDVRVAALIDPGHGGAVDRELSTAYGSPAGGGIAGAVTAVLEKDINLEVARRVCDHLGPNGVLTRSGDYNLSLRERIERARAASAAAFVSIHSNTGRTDSGGPEVWVYGDSRTRAGAPSRQLARRIRQELATLDRTPVPVRSGRLAVLRPDLHGRAVAACLVETGSLEHPRGAARLTNPGALDQIGAAVARGVSLYLSRDLRGANGGRRYGGLDASPFDSDGGDVAVMDEPDTEREPAQACFHESGEATQSNWWDTAIPAGALADTAPPELRELLTYLGISYATFAPREGVYFAKLCEHLVRHGVVAAGTVIDRSNFAAAVSTFQTRNRLVADGTPGERTVWALQHDWAVARRLATRIVTADQVAGSGGFTTFKLREDIVDRYDALRRAVVAQGGVITSAGSMRDLSATVSAGRSSTSMHYSGLALDLATDTGMHNVTTNPYLITTEGRLWRVYCRSETGTERELDAVIWSAGATSTRRVRAKVIDFTALAEANGFTRIPPRSTFPASYMSAEWWHFQCELPLTPWLSQFGIELLSLAAYNETMLAKHTDLWANRMKIFKRGSGGWY